ncbi:MAG: bifunctional 5,10-methylene-tetrahydrofolate dehydrogenase/5,10-methylene-tetrahydrofolate cyclohydrolase, partial [Clostridia bacterium]|nr:bifunctional 5,10-methylene-tetrahydrofolate dehydrogenase/5,10-methylene-tetrahydrofolate cyclohydrolase [Clostridia bacterium]
MQLINGKEIQQLTFTEIKEEVLALKNQGAEPCLAVIIVGNDPASRVYVNNKKKACETVGIKSLEYALPEETTTEELLDLIEKLNSDKTVNGILCQLPVPKHINKLAILESISPDKDVDCFHPVNVGKLSLDRAQLVPCTPAGVIRMLDVAGVEIEGKRAVVIGRSDIVGKPMGIMLMERNATDTVCHTKTKD